jgi:protein gp37
MTMAKRLKGMGQAEVPARRRPAHQRPGLPRARVARRARPAAALDEAARIFVNSMSDLFHDNISDEYIAEVFAVMALAPQHTFQILTKRHARMRSLLSSADFAGRTRW